MNNGPLALAHHREVNDGTPDVVLGRGAHGDRVEHATHRPRAQHAVVASRQNKLVRVRRRDCADRAAVLVQRVHELGWAPQLQRAPRTRVRAAARPLPAAEHPAQARGQRWNAERPYEQLKVLRVDETRQRA